MSDDQAENMVESVSSETLEIARKRLISIGGKFSELHFRQIFSLFPGKLRPEAQGLR